MVTGAIGGTSAHPAGTGPCGASVTSRTLRTPVQPTGGWGWIGWRAARRSSTGPGGGGCSAGGGRMLTGSGGGGWRPGAGAGGSATT